MGQGGGLAPKKVVKNAKSRVAAHTRLYLGVSLSEVICTAFGHMEEIFLLLCYKVTPDKH